MITALTFNSGCYDWGHMGKQAMHDYFQINCWQFCCQSGDYYRHCEFQIIDWRPNMVTNYITVGSDLSWPNPRQKLCSRIKWSSVPQPPDGRPHLFRGVSNFYLLLHGLFFFGHLFFFRVKNSAAAIRMPRSPTKCSPYFQPYLLIKINLAAEDIACFLLDWNS